MRENENDVSLDAAILFIERVCFQHEAFFYNLEVGFEVR